MCENDDIKALWKCTLNVRNVVKIFDISLNCFLFDEPPEKDQYYITGGYL